MKKIIQQPLLILLVLLSVLLSACTTTSTSFTTPYSSAEKNAYNSDYDKDKAAKTRLNLGLRYLAQGDYVKAKYNLDRAAEMNPNNEDTLRALAWYYEQVNENAMAEQYYKKALKVNSKNPALLNQYGVFLCRNERFDESFDLFTRSVKIIANNDVSGTYENAATCKLMAGDDVTAEQLYRKALNHNPEQKDSLFGMARIEFKKDRFNRARAYLARFEKVGSHSSRTLWLALRTESKLNNMDGVASYALKLENFFPDSDETALYLDTKSQWLK